MSTLIKANGEQTQVQPEHGEQWTLRELQAFVGGYIQILGLPDGRAMVVNEEGMIEGLPRNDTATVLAYNASVSHRGIVGDVLVCEPGALG